MRSYWADAPWANSGCAQGSSISLWPNSGARNAPRHSRYRTVAGNDALGTSQPLQQAYRAPLVEEAACRWDLFGQAKKGGPARQVEASPSRLRARPPAPGRMEALAGRGYPAVQKPLPPGLAIKARLPVQRDVEVRAVERYAAALPAGAIRRRPLPLRNREIVAPAEALLMTSPSASTVR